MRLISLGRPCEVGFQIRMHSKKSDGDFFDWLITPFDSLMMALNNNFENLLNLDDLYRQEDMNFVNNRVTGIQYGHVFLRDKSHNIPANFLEDLPRVQSKFEYFRRKFCSNADGSQELCFVRRDVNSEQGQVLEARIAEMFPSLDFKIACVNSQDLGIWMLKNPRILDLRVVDGGHDGLGYPQDWATALVEAGLTDHPFDKTKEDIVIPFH